MTAIRYVPVLLCFSFFAIIFDNLPWGSQWNFISGGASQKLTWYPLFCLLCIYIYQRFRGQVPIQEEKKAIRFCGCLLAVSLVSIIYGLIQYPYYDLVFSGPTSQIEKLPAVLEWLHAHGMNISKERLMQIWLTARYIKTTLLGIFYTFGCSFVMYYFIRQKWDWYLELFRKAILCAVLVMMGYSAIELFYLAGNQAAANFLSTINPYLHPIKTNFGWWPPLLWHGQLRSVLSEPSRMGNYAAFALPLLWLAFFVDGRKKKFLYFIVSTCFAFMIFMTQARTAVAILCGLLVVYVLLLLWMRQKVYWKAFGVICLSVLIAFGGSLVFINACVGPKEVKSDNIVNHVENTASAYIENNLMSLNSDSKRSNQARYGVLRAHVQVGLAHPLVGVGNGLATAYVLEAFDEKARESSEVRLWMQYAHDEGVLKWDLGAMNEYVSLFSANGIIGLVTFLFPFLYVLYQLMGRIRKEKGVAQIRRMTITASLVGAMAAGCNGSLNLLYSTWIVLAFAYAAIRNNENE